MFSFVPILIAQRNPKILLVKHPHRMALPSPAKENHKCIQQGFISREDPTILILLVKTFDVPSICGCLKPNNSQNRTQGQVRQYPMEKQISGPVWHTIYPHLLLLKYIFVGAPTMSCERDPLRHFRHGVPCETIISLGLALTWMCIQSKCLITHKIHVYIYMYIYIYTYVYVYIIIMTE